MDGLYRLALIGAADAYVRPKCAALKPTRTASFIDLDWTQRAAQGVMS
jgi:hypothetical protein